MDGNLHDARPLDSGARVTGSRRPVTALAVVDCEDVMIKDCPSWIAPAAIALWLAASATAQAQPAAAPILPTNTAPTAPPVGTASTPDTDPVDSVTVLSRRPEIRTPIPDAKRAQYDADVAKEAAFRAYRASRPQIIGDSKGVSDPNDDSKDFPGLQSYLPN
jgi:hypothetical protein